MNIPKVLNLNVRIAPKTKTALIRKSVKYGGVSIVVRDLIEAFIDNRITINPTKEIKNVD